MKYYHILLARAFWQKYCGDDDGVSGDPAGETSRLGWNGATTTGRDRIAAERLHSGCVTGRVRVRYGGRATIGGLAHLPGRSTFLPTAPPPPPARRWRRQTAACARAIGRSRSQFSRHRSRQSDLQLYSPAGSRSSSDCVHGTGRWIRVQNYFSHSLLTLQITLAPPPGNVSQTISLDWVGSESIFTNPRPPPDPWWVSSAPWIISHNRIIRNW